MPVYRPLLAFCVLTAAISWGCWAPLVLLGEAQAGHGPLKYLHLAGALGPAISGLACAWLFGRQRALLMLFGRIGRWRISLKWHMIAWFGPFVLLAIALSVAWVWGGAEARGAWTGGSVEFAELPLPLYWVGVLAFYGFGEEIGWRGFVLPVLQSRCSALISTLIVSVIWGAWHLPLFWFSPGLANLDVGGVIGWGFSLLTGSVILTWLTNSTRGSILLAAAFHAMMDLAFAPSISPHAIALIGVMVTIWGIGVLIWTRALSRLEKVTLQLEQEDKR